MVTASVPTGEIPTPFDLKMRLNELRMAAPIFVTLAGETLRNTPPHEEFAGFLRVRMENDTKVL